MIEDAKTLGATYVLASWIPHNGALREEEIHSAARDFNGWGQRLKEANLQFGYHPHGFEFEQTPTETLFDVLVRETKPELVFFEMDAFWFGQAGADPAAFLEKYPNRFRILHLKDLARGTEGIHERDGAERSECSFRGRESCGGLRFFERLSGMEWRLILLRMNRRGRMSRCR